MLTVTFALFVIRHPRIPHKYCLVDEGRRGWWLPGGGVDGHETFSEGARREAREEAACSVGDDISLLQIDLSFQKLRYILSATALSETLKTVPDEESQGARWMSVQETLAIHNGIYPVPNAKLRDEEPLIWFSHLDEGGTGYQLNDDFLYHQVEEGAVGVKYDRRDVYTASFHCTLVCRLPGTDEFIMDPASSPDHPKLPTFKLRSMSILDHAREGITKLGLKNATVQGVAAVQDVRRPIDKLDFRASFIVEMESVPSTLKTGRASEFLDPFDARSISRIMRGKVVPIEIFEGRHGA